MNAFLAPGVVLGITTLVAAVANAAGYPALGSFIADPHTAELATGVVIGVSGLVAGILKGVHKAPAA